MIVAAEAAEGCCCCLLCCCCCLSPRTKKWGVSNIYGGVSIQGLMPKLQEPPHLFGELTEPNLPRTAKVLRTSYGFGNRARTGNGNTYTLICTDVTHSGLAPPCELDKRCLQSASPLVTCRRSQDNTAAEGCCCYWCAAELLLLLLLYSVLQLRYEALTH